MTPGNPLATVLYIPHGGGPLPLLNDPGHARLIQFLRSQAVPAKKPDSIIVISAHWEEPVIAITAAQSPALIYDYSGFPPETYRYQYPAPGNPRLAEHVHKLLQQGEIDATLDHERGFDHGVFVPLMLMYPDADISCIQVSLSKDLDPAFHIRIGQALHQLYSENLLILGSGFSFHNMQALMSKRDDLIDDRNQEFDTWLTQTCSDDNLSETEREALLIEWEYAPQARYCHPREEHLLPLHVCYGIAQQSAEVVFQDRVAGFVASAIKWGQ